MNERIQELMLEAEYAAPHLATRANKLADLIVRECALIVQEFVDHRIPASEYPERLKQHFGVENEP